MTGGRTRLVVLGASGRCGRRAVVVARARGHAVTAVARPASGYEPPEGVTLRRGEALDRRFVADALAGHEVVVSCIGQRRRGRSPWSKRLSPRRLVEKVMVNVVDAVGEDGPGRVVWLSAGGVGSSRALATAPVRWLIGAGEIGVAYRDLEAAEKVVSDADVGSVAVRPVTLRSGAPGGRAAPVSRYGLFSTVRRGDVAEWMIDLADGTRAWEGGAVLLGEAR